MAGVVLRLYPKEGLKLLEMSKIIPLRKFAIIVFTLFSFWPVLSAQQLEISAVHTDDFPQIQVELENYENSDDCDLIVREDDRILEDVLVTKTKDGSTFITFETSSPRNGARHEVGVQLNEEPETVEAYIAPKLYSLYDFFKLLGSLGLFLFGMKFMSEGIQKASGDRLRDILGIMTSNRFLGVMTGFLVTAIIQSSSATTVMVVSFTNAGLFNLAQSIGVIMGANIGTTVTGWIISYLGLKVSLSYYSLPILGIAFPFLFFGEDKIRNWAEFFIGFALLFIGLGELKGAVPDIRANPEVLAFLEGWTDMGFGSILIFIFVGAVLTVIVQSSSASMALTLVLMNNGWIDFPTAAALVLGENIGTTITAQLAALIANAEAKRAAMAHTLFNVTGIVWILLLFTPFIGLVSYILYVGTGGNLDLDLINEDRAVIAKHGPIALAVFHTSFNVINTFLLVWFVKSIEGIVKKIVPNRARLGEEAGLRYINSGMMAAPELALVEARKEIKEFGHLTFKMFRYAQMLMLRRNDRHKKIMKRLRRFDEDCDKNEVVLAQYLAKVSMQNLSTATSMKIRSMWTMINELERIGDLQYRLGQLIERKIKSRYTFSEETEKGIQEMFDLLEDFYDIMLSNLGKDNPASIDQIEEMERLINEKRSELRNHEFVQIENGTISFQTGQVAIEIISILEKIGDHIHRVNLATLGVK